jgi:hypothetical protein
MQDGARVWADWSDDVPETETDSPAIMRQRASGRYRPLLGDVTVALVGMHMSPRYINSRVPQYLLFE